MPKAVILKGPKSESRSFITVLPDSMEALIQKARDLFIMPPNHTPHFTLGDDSKVIVLPDFLPLLQEREVLVFRWSPDTPRSSLRKSIGLSHASPETQEVETETDNYEQVNEGNDEGGKTVRGVRWDHTVISNEDKSRRQASRPRGPREGKDSAASRHRAEYARQKLREQEELRLRELSAQQKPCIGEDPFAASTDKETDPNHLTSPSLMSSCKSAHSLLQLSREDLLVSGSSPPSYSSPKEQNQQAEEEQQTSSPLASPTRDVRGAQKGEYGRMLVMGIQGEKTLKIGEADQHSASNHREEGAVPQRTQAAATATPPATPPEERNCSESSVEEDQNTNREEQQEECEGDEDELEEQAVEQATSPQKTSEINVRNVPAYQTMKTIVNQLRSHPANRHFRQPFGPEMQRFCQEHDRPLVDLFSIAQCIATGQYGLEEPLKNFCSDLERMWSNVRSFHTPHSEQTQSADILETFSGILLDEWKRRAATKIMTATSRPANVRPKVPGTYSTPMSRIEKRNSIKAGHDGTPKTQQQAYFASLVAKTGLVSSTGGSPSTMSGKSSGQGLKRSAAPVSPDQSAPPTKRAQTGEMSLAIPVITMTNSAGKGTKDSKATKVLTEKIITRGVARRTAA